jgi:hypothetical protein
MLWKEMGPMLGVTSEQVAALFRGAMDACTEDAHGFLAGVHQTWPSIRARDTQHINARLRCIADTTIAEVEAEQVGI